MTLERAVEAFAGFMVLLSVALTYFVHPNWIWLTVKLGAVAQPNTPSHTKIALALDILIIQAVPPSLLRVKISLVPVGDAKYVFFLGNFGQTKLLEVVHFFGVVG